MEMSRCGPQRRQRLKKHGCKLPTDMLELILAAADAPTKMACAQASAFLRHILTTSCVWKEELRLDLHDTRQLLWLEAHCRVVQSVSICIESCLVGRLNRLIRQVGFPRLQRLAVYNSPDDPEQNRMSVLELGNLPLVHLHISNRGWSPLVSTHHLPASLRSVSFEPCQKTDAQVFFGGRHVRACISLCDSARRWRFVEHLPLELTSLRLFCCGQDLIEAMPSLTRLTNLTQLDVDVGFTSNSPSSYTADMPVDLVQRLRQHARPQAQHLLQAIQAVPSLQRVGVHSALESHHVNLPDLGSVEVCRTLSVINEFGWSPSIEQQVDEATRPRMSSLVVHFLSIDACPSLHGFSMLRELVLAHCSRDFASVCPDPFSVVGLDAVASTLTRLVVSTDRALTSVHLPSGLRLQSLMLVCPGTLAVHGRVTRLCPRLKEALLGCAELAGNGTELASLLRCRLSSAELEVLGSQPLRQRLRFTHATLVGQWWQGVHYKSMCSMRWGCHCCKVRVWADGRPCPAHTAFARYGIVSAHTDDRNPWLDPYDHQPGAVPAWHSPCLLWESKC